MQTLQISPTVITALKVKAVNLLMIALKGNGTAHGCSANLSVLHRLANVRKPELVNLVKCNTFQNSLVSHCPQPKILLWTQPCKHPAN